MNRAELVEWIANDMETTKADADRFITSFAQAIYKNIKKDAIKISGFGVFSSKKRKAKKGRNPQTGEEITIPSKWTPVFKAGSALKESVAANKK